MKMQRGRLRVGLAIAALAGLAGRGVAQTVNYQGTMTVSASSKSLAAANVTMAAWSPSLPANFLWLTIINTGSNALTLCWKGGNAATDTGCETLGAGASDRVHLGNGTTAPTLASSAGTTVSFHD